MARAAMSMWKASANSRPTRVTIDFNDAYNPNCARSAHFTCPLAVDTIPLAMTAGERDPHGLH